jgi:hypothetical protein
LRIRELIRNSNDHIYSEARTFVLNCCHPSATIHREVEIARLGLLFGALAPTTTVPGLEALIVEAGNVHASLHPGVAWVRRVAGGEETIRGRPGDPFATMEPDLVADPHGGS